MTEASNLSLPARIEIAARKLVRDKMILASEMSSVIAQAHIDVERCGFVHLGSETIRATRMEMDAFASANIRRMSDAQFERFAYGL